MCGQENSITMSKTPKSPPLSSRRLASLVFGVVALLFSFVPSVRAAVGASGTVLYTPPLTTLTGNMPFSSPYVLSVTAPVNLSGPSTIGFTINPTTVPAGMSVATAQSLISIVPITTGTFTTGGQVLQFTVTGSFPVVTPAVGESSVSYAYQIYTSNWTVNGSLVDSGFSLGATATVQTGGGTSTQPPTVSIAAPVNGSVINLSYGTVFPIQVALTFSGAAPIGSVVDSLSANLGGSGLAVTTSALPAVSGTGSATMTIPGPGTYTAGVGAFNSVGSAIASTTFAVVVAPQFSPPDVTISTPSDASTITVGPGALPITVPIQFTSTSSTPTASAITSVSLTVDGLAVPTTSTGLNSVAVNSAASVQISTPGAHTVSASATNLGGTASDLNTFTVIVQAAPPTVVINSPTPNSSYDYRIGTAATVVPFTFTATSSFGGIRTLTAKVDGANVVFTPSGLNTLTATGTINLPYTTGGTHTVSVTTTDDNGTATAASNFIVNVIAPTPTIVINQPTAGATFSVPTGSTTVSVPYSFVTTSNNGFVVNSVTATLDGNPITIGGTTGLGTASATSSGTLTGVSPGTHTLVATGVSSGITVSTSKTFTVTSVQPPPSVVINTPPVGSTYTRTSSGPTISIPLTFTGTSNATNGVITQLKATLNGSPVTVNSTTLNQKIANGSGTLVVSAAGTYTISVAAVDAVGTASATRTFTVAVVQPRTICGSIFFDVDGDGNYDCEDFDIAGITVKLYNSTNSLVGTDVTDNCGDYSFCNIAPGTYRVVATAYAGLKASTVSERTVTVTNCNLTVPRIGFRLDFVAMRTMTAAGKDVAFWKYNLDKANSCKTSGIQISASTLSSYTSKIGNSALSAYDNITMKQAASLMNTSAPSNNNCYTSYSSSSCYGGSYSYGSNCSSSNNTCSTWSPLSRELIASEYNYQRATYIGGNKNLTYMFIWWGEHVLLNPNKYGSTYTTFAKNWCAAYNNSNGGAVNGPLN
jgi:hypothetical protein